MDNKEFFVLILSVIGGLFSILASIFDWNFFFENRKTKLFVSMMGRNGARIFYSILGLGLLFLAYKMYLK